MATKEPYRKNEYHNPNLEFGILSKDKVFLKWLVVSSEEISHIPIFRSVLLSEKTSRKQFLT
ncbi:hypothetical protein LEP1GSC059_1467 [Leptospira noguchii serovar Panama str. CZ214]|uniref:Uncharacterized protein n=1 Tax=Leptospira noguchii serovar Panama str. CZ214 TaxID=1001595 RepID=T0GVR7_9LEPT|nr:hypothetical protein LEP1GSC059_1467 [Leptospira noguchii serovar Panama str. CZ214]